MPMVIVAGTNGKGSVCAFLEAFLEAAGRKVGCYTSPHVLRFNERICCNGKPVNDESIVAALKKVDAARQGTALTYFELTTLAAAVIFAEQACDVSVLEVGLGGRLDAVNIFSPAVSVITTIALDHKEFLGDTRDAIAVEKAGVCRRQRPVVIGDWQPPMALLSAVAEHGAVAKLIGCDFSSAAAGRCWHYQSARRHISNLPMPALLGEHQLSNAACALAALECLPEDYWPGNGAIRTGLHTVRLPGRAQVLPGRPAIVLDVAHNPSAACALERFLFGMGYYPYTRAVLGMLARKDIGAFVSALEKRIDAWYVAPPQDGDLSTEAIVKAVQATTDREIFSFPSIAQAMQSAVADSAKDDRIVATGSFLTVADALASLQSLNRHDDGYH